MCAISNLTLSEFRASAKALHRSPDWVSEATVTYRLRGRKLPMRGTISDFLQAEAGALDPVRNFPIYQNQRNRPNRHYVAQLRRHVFCESLLEASVLVELEFEEKLTAVAPQPFTVHIPLLTAGSTIHTPDFYVLLANGERRVIDVKPPERVGEVMQVHALRMQQLADYADFSYELRTGYGQPARSTLRWLSAYRRIDAANSEICDRVLTLLGSGRVPIGDVVSRLRLTPIELPILFSLIWHRVLHISLDEPVTRDSLVWKAVQNDG